MSHPNNPPNIQYNTFLEKLATAAQHVLRWGPEKFIYQPLGQCRHCKAADYFEPLHFGICETCGINCNTRFVKAKSDFVSRLGSHPCQFCGKVVTSLQITGFDYYCHLFVSTYFFKSPLYLGRPTPYPKYDFFNITINGYSPNAFLTDEYCDKVTHLMYVWQLPYNPRFQAERDYYYDIQEELIQYGANERVSPFVCPDR